MWVQTSHCVKVVDFVCYICWNSFWLMSGRLCPIGLLPSDEKLISPSTNVILDQYSLTGSLWLAHDSFTFHILGYLNTIYTYLKFWGECPHKSARSFLTYYKFFCEEILIIKFILWNLKGSPCGGHWKDTTFNSIIHT